MIPQRAIFTLLTLALFGCSTGGKLAIHSARDPKTALKSGFESGIYRLDDRANITILLFDGPADDPTQAVTIRVHWAPRTARTPLDPGATNATIRYIIFGGEDHRQVGIYSGAGYLYPRGRFGQGHLAFNVWQANLRLTDSSGGFNDLLGQARLKGTFTAHRGDQAMPEAMRRLNILISRRLGYPQYVHADRGSF